MRSENARQRIRFLGGLAMAQRAGGLIPFQKPIHWAAEGNGARPKLKRTANALAAGACFRYAHWQKHLAPVHVFAMQGIIRCIRLTHSTAMRSQLHDTVCPAAKRCEFLGDFFRKI